MSNITSHNAMESEDISSEIDGTKKVSTWAKIAGNVIEQPHIVNEGPKHNIVLQSDTFVYTPDMRFDDRYGHVIFDKMFNVYEKYQREYYFLDLSLSKIYELFRKHVDISRFFPSEDYESSNDSENDYGYDRIVQTYNEYSHDI